MMIEFLFVIALVAGALAIVLYATWLFVHRLRGGESKTKSFREWLRNIFEAIIGLG
jgi:TRAP-type C4-dicarboxylate transport system permease large subunit